jgi:IPT/TIG domain
MKDQVAAETPPGTPGLRALGAMENAVRRVRAAQGETPRPPGPPTAPPAAPAAPERAPSDGRSPHPWRQPDRWLVTCIAVVATLLVVAAAGLAASLDSVPRTLNSSPPGHASGGRAATTVPVHPHGVGAPSTPSTTSIEPSSAPPATTGGPPVISALEPASGAPGQGIEVAGANFVSSNGQILATFNGQIAPTSCPAQNACTVTVPPSAGGPTAQVTISTASGTSNAVTFTYS